MGKRLGISARFWWLVSLSSFLVACGHGDGVQVFTQDEIGAEIRVTAEEQFEIHLESNPSTGYAWEISPMTTPDLVALEGKTYVGPDDPDLVGAPGTDVFVFAAGDEGAGVLRLEYVRSFDDPILPDRVAEFIIRIDNSEWPPARGTVPPTNTAVAAE